MCSKGALADAVNMDETGSSSNDHHHHQQSNGGDGGAYAYKNEISLSIGDEDQSSRTNSTAVPTPSPRHIEVPMGAAGPDAETTNEYAPVLNRSGGGGGSGSPSSAKSNGLDNPAFELEQDKRPLSSFGHGKDEKSLGVVSVNGKTVGEKPLAEAVNLELLNMSSKPPATNGHHQNGTNGGAGALPAKKDTEVDLGDPYDEYFVPVNEHRKFMR